MDAFQLYKDIKTRTKGEIYIGVVGPVRTGKSTFIKRFMDILVLPRIEDVHGREQARDELPQSSSGRTIMTTEPKFIPKEGAEITISEDVKVRVRLIDCVGYMAEGAVGHMENDVERQVKTPWFDYDIPFTQAASIGTKKVIHDHATIGIVVTADGSFGEIPGSAYRNAEEKTIKELKAIGKPFAVLVNSQKPYSDEARETVKDIRERYDIEALPVNCEQLKETDIEKILEAVLLKFPVSEVAFYIPKWVEMLPREHRIKQDLILHVRELMDQFAEVGDVKGVEMGDSEYIESVRVEDVKLDSGAVSLRIDVAESFYYEMLSELTGTPIIGQYELVSTIRQLAEQKKEYDGIREALASVRMRGYGVVSPGKEEIILREPEVIRQGNKYGVKIHSEAPSIHLIKANIETEIAPIVGSEQQAKDLMAYIEDARETEGGIWGTHIFGKSIEDLVMDGMKAKLSMINDDSQMKLQDTMQKIVNDSSGGMVCIII